MTIHGQSQHYVRVLIIIFAFAFLFYQVLSNDDTRYGYNAARNQYEDLMAVGIIDPTKVVRCCIEHAASVAKTFLTSDAVVIDIDGPVVEGMRLPKQSPKPKPPTPMPMPMPTSGNQLDSDTYMSCVFLFMLTCVCDHTGTGLMGF